MSFLLSEEDQCTFFNICTESNNFLTGLSRLLSYDPENEEEIRRAMLAISHDFNTTQNDIETSMQQNRIEFNQKVLIVIFVIF